MGFLKISFYENIYENTDALFDLFSRLFQIFKEK